MNGPFQCYREWGFPRIFFQRPFVHQNIAIGDLGKQVIVKLDVIIESC